MQKKGKEQVVITVGSEKVTLDEITQRIRNSPLSYQEYLATELGQKQFVDILLKQRIMVTLAKRSKLDKRKEIQDTLKEFKQAYKLKLKQYEEELLIGEYLKELENTDLRITDMELEKYYNEHKKDYTNPKEVRLSHILLSSEAAAKQAIDKLAAGSDFENLAKEISLDPATNIRGGDLGTFKSGELLKEFVDVVRKLKVSEITKVPVKTTYGYHILKKTAEKSPPKIKFEDAKQEIRQILLKDKFDKWIEKQKELLNVKVDYSAFESIKK
ncbi:MAG: peptidylprolyl isomerase [Elusimicrobiota bacterium]|nr:peptidylprolyl isomerase [Elusimicrobiota bacterium]